LVKLARSDRVAFGELFDHFYPLIFAYCMRRLVVRAIAEDVASEVFLKVAEGIRDFVFRSPGGHRCYRSWRQFPKLML
jgi:DNA-directed RNA polymerase specialized sigma24 family protein